MMFTKRELRSMASAYKKGATLMELAEQYDVSTSTVSRALARSNVEMRPRGRKPQ